MFHRQYLGKFKNTVLTDQHTGYSQTSSIIEIVQQLFIYAKFMWQWKFSYQQYRYNLLIF